MNDFRTKTTLELKRYLISTLASYEDHTIVFNSTSQVGEPEVECKIADLPSFPGNTRGIQYTVLSISVDDTTMFEDNTHMVDLDLSMEEVTVEIVDFDNISDYQDDYPFVGVNDQPDFLRSLCEAIDQQLNA